MPTRQQISVALDEKFLSFVAKKRKDIPEKLKELSILELYRRKEISSGKAAELLGMERFEFVRYASRLGIPFFDMSKEELEKDLESAKRIYEQVK
jgi:predicted HTH domain antitoxin